MLKIHIKIRIFLWILLIIAISWFLYMGIVPSGKIIYVQDFNSKSDFIQKLGPKERVEPAKEGRQKIIGDPVYFSLRTPRKFNKANLILKYRNKSNLPIVEAGILMDKKIWHYQLKPAENKIIDELYSKWHVIEENGVVLLQEEEKFKTISQFISNLPARKKMALYNYDLKNDFIMKNYEPSPEKNQKIPFSLRGDFQIFTYIKDENLGLSLEILDLNKNKDSDSIDLNLYYRGKLIDARHFDDDGNNSDNGQIGMARILDLNWANLPEGVYKIDLRANDDIVFQNLISAQSKISFGRKLWIYKNGIKNLSLFTDSRRVNAQTVNPGSLQILGVGDQKLELEKTYKLYSLKVTEADLIEIKIPKDGLIISGDGVFSSSEDSLFDSDFQKITPDLDIEKSEINYVLAKYKKPSVDGGWNLAELEFDINGSYREFNKNSFIISVPGLRADDEKEEFLELKEVKIELEGKSLRTKIRELLN